MDLIDEPTTPQGLLTEIDELTIPKGFIHELTTPKRAFNAFQKLPSHGSYNSRRKPTPKRPTFSPSPSPPLKLELEVKSNRKRSAEDEWTQVASRGKLQVKGFLHNSHKLWVVCSRTQVASRGKGFFITPISYGLSAAGHRLQVVESFR